MVDDHNKAKEIGEVLNGLTFIKKVEPVETNIIIFELRQKTDETKFLRLLEANNIRLSGMGQGKLRIVTHLDYTDAMHDRFLSVLKQVKI